MGELKERVELGEKVRQFIEAYYDAYRLRFPNSQPMDLRDGRTIGAIKQFVKNFTAEQSKLLIQTYMKMEDPWFKNKCYDFQTFRSNLNKVSQAIDSGTTEDTINWGRVFPDDKG